MFNIIGNEDGLWASTRRYDRLGLVLLRERSRLSWEMGAVHQHIRVYIMWNHPLSSKRSTIFQRSGSHAVFHTAPTQPLSIPRSNEHSWSRFASVDLQRTVYTGFERLQIVEGDYYCGTALGRYFFERPIVSMGGWKANKDANTSLVEWTTAQLTWNMPHHWPGSPENLRNYHFPHSEP